MYTDVTEEERHVSFWLHESANVVCGILCTDIAFEGTMNYPTIKGRSGWSGCICFNALSVDEGAVWGF